MSLTTPTPSASVEGSNGAPQAIETDRFPPPPPPFFPPAPPIPGQFNCTNYFQFPCPPAPPPNTTTVTPTIITSCIAIITTSTIFTNVVSTSITTSLSITPVYVPPDPTLSAALTAETSLLKSNSALAKGNITATSILGAITIILLLVIALFFFFWLRRRLRRKTRNGRDDESLHFTSMVAPNRPLPDPRGERPGTGRSVASTQAIPSGFAGPRDSGKEREATSLSMGPRGGGYSAAALMSNPVTRKRPVPVSGPAKEVKVAKRSSSAPNLKPPSRPPRIPTLRGLPSINILPNTPSMRGKRGEGSSSPSPISALDPETSAGGAESGSLRTREGPRQTRGRGTMTGYSARYHEALREEAERERSRIRAENAGRLGLPVVERQGGGGAAGVRSQRASVSTIGSEMARYAGGNGGGQTAEGNSGGTGGPTAGASGNGGQREKVLHSTRASSGVFPEGEGDSDDEDDGDGEEKGEQERDADEDWSRRGSRGSGDKEVLPKGKEKEKE